MSGVTAALGGMVGGASSYAVSISPVSVSGSYHGASSGGQNITTGTALATATGGRAPYTYAWSQVGTTPDTWVINSAATASTTFTAQSIGPGVLADATFLVTVTDTNGTVRTAQVSAHVVNASTA